MLLAIGAVRRHLMDSGLRMRLGIVAETGDAWDIHHFAALIGYGCEVVYPWLALQSVTALFSERRRPRTEEARPSARAGRAGTTSADRPAPEEARRRFRAAAEKGLLKIMSKMGISVLPSYNGAQIFECLGLGHEVIERCFRGTDSPIGGIGFEEIAEDVLIRHRGWPTAAADAEPLERCPTTAGSASARRARITAGRRRSWWRCRRRWAAARPKRRGRHRTGYARFKEFIAQVEERRPANPRDLLGFRRGTPIPLAEVEPVEAIMRRFVSSAMSLGALSPEAHATLSIAHEPDRVPAPTPGEGGEDPVQLCRRCPTATGWTTGSSRWPRAASA